MRSAWPSLLPSGALLAGFFFLGATPKGPPFGIERAELDALLTPYFDLIEDEPVERFDRRVRRSRTLDDLAPPAREPAT